MSVGWHDGRSYGNAPLGTARWNPFRNVGFDREECKWGLEATCPSAVWLRPTAVGPPNHKTTPLWLRVGRRALQLHLQLDALFGGYLVDPASSHMLVSKIKPCMSKYKLLIL